MTVVPSLLLSPMELGCEFKDEKDASEEIVDEDDILAVVLWHFLFGAVVAGCLVKPNVMV